MNRWLQTRLYECPRCEASYLHDKAYVHDLFVCPNRVQTAGVKANHQPANQEDNNGAHVSRKS